jgi:divalent metal cation (Fe/Co/Zn/Cd) transporter
MKTLHLGPEEIMVAAKIAVRPTESAAEVAALIDRAEVAIRGAEPMVTALYLEPDIYSETYRPAPRPERPGAPAH